MAKLTVTKAPPVPETPSEQIIADANGIYHVTDANGRVIGFKKPGMNSRRRVFKVISAASAEKDRYLGLVMVAACVVEIDGESVSFPTTELQFDALLDRLEDASFQAVGNALQKMGIGQSEEEVKTEAGE